MATMNDLLMNRAQALKQVDHQAEKAAKEAKQQENLTLNSALLRHKKFTEKKSSADEGTDRAREEEQRAKQEEKREAEEKEKEYNRRVADPNCCVTCGKTVDKTAKDTMGAIDRLWHTDCWKCSYCRQTLPFPGEFYHVGCKLLCPKDYKMRFFCAHCEKPITGESLSLFNKSWHRECLNERGCFTCGKSIEDEEFLLACDCAFHKGCLKCDKCSAITDEQFILANGRPWCVKCNEKFLKENPGARKDLTRKLHQVRVFQAEPQENTCPRCNKPVNAGINAIGHTWCNECFLCNKCNVCITHIGYFPNEDETEAYCENCYNDEEAEKCANCNKAITADVMTVLGKSFHPECFVCALCKQKLGNEVVELNGDAVCGICARRDRIKQGHKA